MLFSRFVCPIFGSSNGASATRNELKTDDDQTGRKIMKGTIAALVVALFASVSIAPAAQADSFEDYLHTLELTGI